MTSFRTRDVLRMAETGEVVRVTSVHTNYMAWGLDEHGHFGITEMWSETNGVRTNELEASKQTPPVGNDRPTKGTSK